MSLVSVLSQKRLLEGGRLEMVESGAPGCSITGSNAPLPCLGSTVAVTLAMTLCVLLVVLLMVVVVLLGNIVDTTLSGTVDTARRQ